MLKSPVELQTPFRETGWSRTRQKFGGENFSNTTKAKLFSTRCLSPSPSSVQQTATTMMHVVAAMRVDAAYLAPKQRLPFMKNVTKFSSVHRRQTTNCQNGLVKVDIFDILRLGAVGEIIFGSNPELMQSSYNYLQNVFHKGHLVDSEHEGNGGTLGCLCIRNALTTGHVTSLHHRISWATCRCAFWRRPSWYERPVDPAPCGRMCSRAARADGATSRRCNLKCAETMHLWKDHVAHIETALQACCLCVKQL